MLRESSHVYVVSGYYLDELGNEQFYQTKFDLTDLSTPTSIAEEDEAFRVTIYPNPVTSVLTISGFSVKDIEVVSILDNLGRIVDSFSPMSPTVYYDCSRLPHGPYHVKGTGQASFSRQFIVR